MFEKQFHLAGWVQDLEGELAGADFARAIGVFAYYLKGAGEAFEEAAASTERRRELAFMLHLAARLNQHLTAKLLADTPD